jgi:hypothetical protein
MSNTSWQCPYCNHHVTITEHNYKLYANFLHADTAHGMVGVQIFSRRCPNESCKEFDLTVTVNPVSRSREFSDRYREAIMTFNLRPDSIAKPQPDYIPTAIRQDYEEACKILHLSPKASATLSRRCLQGMIRDFWREKVKDLKKADLWQEIQAIQNVVEPETWEAIKATKDVGNIGAHMEKDVNLIIDVNPEEAKQLIGLLEFLFKDWYIAKHTRSEQSKRLRETAELKKRQKEAGKDNATPSTLAEQYLPQTV